MQNATEVRLKFKINETRTNSHQQRLYAWWASKLVRCCCSAVNDPLYLKSSASIRKSCWQRFISSSFILYLFRFYLAVTPKVLRTCPGCRLGAFPAGIARLGLTHGLPVKLGCFMTVTVRRVPLHHLHASQLTWDWRIKRTDLIRHKWQSCSRSWTTYEFQVSVKSLLTRPLSTDSSPFILCCDESDSMVIWLSWC